MPRSPNRQKIFSVRLFGRRFGAGAGALAVLAAGSVGAAGMSESGLGPDRVFAGDGVSALARADALDLAEAARSLAEALAGQPLYLGSRAEARGHAAVSDAIGAPVLDRVGIAIARVRDIHLVGGVPRSLVIGHEGAATGGRFGLTPGAVRAPLDPRRFRATGDGLVYAPSWSQADIAAFPVSATIPSGRDAVPATSPRALPEAPSGASRTPVSLASLAGRSVSDAAGAWAGQVVDILFASGDRPVFVLLETGRGPGTPFGDPRVVAVNWRAFEGREGTLTLKLTRRDLRAAPAFETGRGERIEDATEKAAAL
jgi:hypothetical protein